MANTGQHLVNHIATNSSAHPEPSGGTILGEVVETLEDAAKKPDPLRKLLMLVVAALFLGGGGAVANFSAIWGLPDRVAAMEQQQARMAKQLEEIAKAVGAKVTPKEEP
jgi:hypothetical protein